MKQFQFYILYFLTYFIGEHLTEALTLMSSAREFRVNRFGGCPDDEQNPMHFKGIVLSKSDQQNKFTLNGEFITSSNITAPLEVRNKKKNFFYKQSR